MERQINWPKQNSELFTLSGLRRKWKVSQHELNKINKKKQILNKK